MIRSSIMYCHRQVWDSVFAGMHSGGANYAQGPVAVGKQLGMLTKVTQAGSSAASHDREPILFLGKEQQQYVLEADTSVAHNIVKYIYNAAEKASLTWHLVMQSWSNLQVR